MTENCIFTNPVVGDGKVTIPKHIREVLGIERGDLVEVQILRVFKAGRGGLLRKGEVVSYESP